MPEERRKTFTGSLHFLLALAFVEHKRQSSERIINYDSKRFNHSSRLRAAEVAFLWSRARGGENAGETSFRDCREDVNRPRPPKPEELKLSHCR